MLPSTIQFGLHVPRTSTRFFVRFLLSMKLLPNWVILPKGSFVFYLVFKESKLCVRTSQDFSWQIFHGANNFENYKTVANKIEIVLTIKSKLHKARSVHCKKAAKYVLCLLSDRQKWQVSFVSWLLTHCESKSFSFICLLENLKTSQYKRCSGTELVCSVTFCFSKTKLKLSFYLLENKLNHLFCG